MNTCGVLVTALIVASCCLYSTHAQKALPTCKPCAALKCKDGKNCTHEPLVECAPVGICRGKIVKERCGCCDVCETTIGHRCRDEKEPITEQVCGVGLKCVVSEEAQLEFEVGIKKKSSCRCEKETLDCLDPVNKQTYRHGEIWTRGDFACEACVCGSNGKPKCSTLRCEKVTCVDSKRVEDRCCAFCMRDDWNKGCQYDGSMYFDGEIVLLQDQRSVCKCEKKKWSCVKDTLHGFSNLSENPQCKEEVRDEPLKKWSIWLPSECAHCECGEGGQGNCSVLHCTIPRCQDPFKIKGRCCSVCPEDFQTMCNYDGRKYLTGEKTVLPDRCTLCTCTNSDWHCSSERCKGSKFIKDPLTMSAP